jgi:hypothetical protein
MRVAAAPELLPKSSNVHLGTAWVMMWNALAIQVTDEALTGFLAVYNPTVLALRAKLSFFPMPTFEFREWLTALWPMGWTRQERFDKIPATDRRAARRP